MSNSTQILSQEARQCLSDSGESLIFHGGWQTIRCVALNPSSQSENSVDIPIVLESPEALEILAFTPLMALQIYNRFLEGSPAIASEEIISCVNEHIRSFQTLGEADESSEAVMDQMGLRKDLQEGILAPAFSDIRVTADISFWILDTIDMNYE